MNVEIKQVADPIYANARGAAWIAAVGMGEIQFSDISELVQYKKCYQPQSQNRALYEDEGWVDYLCEQMKSIYQRLNH